MRNFWIAAAALAAVGAAPSGCIVHDHGHGHTSVGVGVGVGYHDHHYSYYPDFHAYHCGGCGFWWAFAGGVWVEHRTRPSHIHVSPSVVVIDIDERGPEPWVHHEKHMRKVPPGWKADRPGKGPPPGRGWKSD